MLKLSEIKELIKLIDQTSVQELEIENEGTRLLIRKPNKTESVMINPVPAYQTIPSVSMQMPAQQLQVRDQPVVENKAEIKQEAPSDNLVRITSPMVGTFYHASAPGAPSFVQKGDKVKEKTVVCIIEAMKLMNEIEAEIKGEIVDILVDNGQLVEYGQPLFLVKPE